MDEDTRLHVPAAPLAPGELLAGRYRLGQIIGRGGVADVFAAQDETLDRPVAVKVFRAQVPGLDDLQRQRSEMRVLAKLNHPGLVAIYDAGFDQAGAGVAEPYLVMELVAGRSLAQRLADGPLAIGDTVALARQLADALSYIHAQQVVHRDIKPANVLLADQPAIAAKLTDFGIAVLAGEARLTATGLTIGTAQYLSPEQALGTGAGPASDVYSLGLLLLECLTGAAAYPGPAVEAALARLHRQPAIPQQLAPPFVALLAAMTARQPEDRPTAAEVSQLAAGLPTDESAALAVSATQAALATALLPPAERPAEQVRTVRAAPLAAGIGALSIAALAAIFAANGAGTAGGKPAAVTSTPPTSVSRTSAASPSVPASSARVVRTSPARSSSAVAPPAPAKPSPTKKKGPPGKHGH